MKKFLATLLCIAMLVSSLGLTSFAAEKAVTLYSLNGDTIKVYESEVSSYTSVGWYKNIEDVQTTVYSLNGKSIKIFKGELDSYLAVGWYKNIDDVKTTIYALDGRSKVIYKGDLDSYLSAGWYKAPMTKLYSLAGKTIIVPKSEVSSYKSVGWHENLSSVQTTLYSLEGKTKTVYKADVDKYLSLGWYKTPVVKLYSNAGKTIVVPKDQVNSYKEVGWHTNIASVQRTLYSTSGKTITVFKDEVAKYVSVGWYKNIEDTQVNVYSADGRKKKIFKDELKNYLSVGWKESMPKVTYISETPVTLTAKKYSTTYTAEITEFYYYGTYTIDDTDDLEIEFDFYHKSDNNELDFALECYDSKANLLDTVDVFYGEYRGGYAYIPKSTAYVKLILDSSYYDSVSGAFTYKNLMTVYGANNSSKEIYDIQFPIYEESGWTKATTLYSLDNRTIEVAPGKVKEYQALGWYTYEGLQYKNFDTSFWSYYNKRDYNNALNTIDTYSWTLSRSSEYSSSWSKLKYKAMDAWRSSTKCPLAYCGDYSYKNGSSVNISLNLRNISYKKIIAFKLTFTCYDIFGGVLNNNTTYYCETANLASGNKRSFTWTNSYMPKFHRIGNVKITNVVYEDNTLWP